MISNRKWFESLLERGKAKSTLLALSIGLALGFASGQTLHSSAASAPPEETAEGGQTVSVPVHSGKQEEANSQNSVRNRFRRSISKHSLPSSMFEPWWRTMMHDPDADWILSTFDPLSSDFDRSMLPVGTGSFMPRLDTTEHGNEIKITAEVPGLEQQNLDVTVTEDAVTIKGEKIQEIDKSSKSDKDLQAIERSYGSFQRTVSLPCKVESDKAVATLKNGVLSITVPKSNVAQTPARKLNIQTQ